MLVTSNNHPLNNKEKIELSDLVKQPFIISKPGFQTREDILNAFSLEGLRPTIHYEIERFETACSLVGEGLGITILPESYLKYSSENKLHIQHINNPALTRSVYLAYFKDRYQPPIVYDLCDRIRHFFDS
ncbi:DNA-binding transcriptional LysR family regulator [Bacillus chungangensis]|uniref:DNA-binding transcriptional LysR family regulator n=1 Tax=Bacillus chungangensis TaxID=587633 RepID=A0ABT9WYY3_9BACI|nr:DNA-binding transcriptional LysR family regulator [Bacillus chungangensis]